MLQKPQKIFASRHRDLFLQRSARVGDRINLIVPESDLTPAGAMPRMRTLQVVGIVDSGHYEYDSSLAIMHWKDAAALLRLQDPSGLRVKVDDMQRAPEIASELAQVVPQALWVSDWSRSNRSGLLLFKPKER